MVKVDIRINSIKEVSVLVGKISTVPFEVDLKSGRYLVDGRSIMGAYSLDWEKPVTMEIHAEREQVKEFLESIDKYIYE